MGHYSELTDEELKEYHNNYSKEYYLKNKKKIQEYNREYQRKWREENWEGYREAMDKCRAKKRGAWVGPLPKGYRSKLRKIQHNLCFYCGCDLSKSGEHLEHKTPLSRGGKHSERNICLSCPSCNISKKDMNEKEFREKTKITNVDIIYNSIKDIIKDMSYEELCEYVRVNYIDV